MLSETVFGGLAGARVIVYVGADVSGRRELVRIEFTRESAIGTAEFKTEMWVGEMRREVLVNGSRVELLYVEKALMLEPATMLRRELYEVTTFFRGGFPGLKL